MSSLGDARVESRLNEGLDALEISVDQKQRARLLQLLALLHKWNRAYNLTSIRAPDDMVVKHLLDSAAVLPFIKGPTLLDVGAGAGFPGLVLAILKPEMEVTLLDSNGKKVRFQRQAVLELDLPRVTPVQVRVEAFDGRFDQVISRAFASLGDFVTLTHHLVATGGQWLAMKGPAVEEELTDLPGNVRAVSCPSLVIPFETASRRLVILEGTQLSRGRP